MIRFVLARIAQGAAMLIIASFFVFLLIRAIPGDPAILLAGTEASEETLEAIRTELGLNKPLITQYTNWVLGAASGDFGTSITFNQPVSSMIARTAPASLQLVIAGMSVTVVLGITLGVWSAMYRRGIIDQAINVVTAVFIGVPVFWLGLLSILVFALQLRWLPASGWINVLDDPVNGLRSLILPSMVLGMPLGSVLARFTRSALIETLSSDYVRAAQARGLTGNQALFRHALRNAMVPVVTIIGVQVGVLIGGAVVVETVYSWPGMGRLVVSALGNRDYPLLQALLLLIMFGFVVVSTLVDVSYGIIDPRLRIRRDG